MKRGCKVRWRYLTMSNDTQPEIRFPGFTEDWEQRKLIDLVVRLNKSTNSSRLPKVEFEDIVAGEGRLNKDVSQKFDNRKGIEFLPNDILYGKLRPYLKNWLKATFTGVAIGDFWVFRAKKSDSDFVYSLIQADRYQKAANDTSGTKMPRSDWKKVSDTVFYIPNDLKEQQKIGIFFKKLDDTITLHQRKLDLLKETKKGFLQKMFPKNGAKVPEVRFPGFTEDWEERKFGEIVQVSRGLTYKPSDVQIEGIRVLRSSNINEDVFVLRDDDVFVKPDAVNIAPIKNGDILITSANGSSRLVGKHAIVNGLQDKTVHGGFMLRVKSKNTWFTNSLMSSRWYNYFINIYVSGGNGAIGNLRKYDLESQTIIVPDDEEQQKIGAFFKQLDDTIALHQRKLDLLKETKKGFLQKMFV